jgi:hypothetical protein
MLRILRLEDCKISSIYPLSSAPFLQEIYLRKNELKTLESLAPLIVCEHLDVLDLTDNPVAQDPKFLFFMRFLFKKYPLPESEVEMNVLLENIRHFCLKPLQVLLFLKPIYAHLDQYVSYDDFTKDKIQGFSAIYKFIHEQDRHIFKHMGAYKAPFLNYLTGSYNSGLLSRDIDSEDKRISFLVGMIKDIYENVSRIQQPNYDVAILSTLQRIKQEMKVWAVSFLQSLWRARKASKAFQTQKQAACTIQCFYKSMKDVVRLRNEFKQKKRMEEKRKHSSIIIQTYWRRYKTRKHYIALKQQTNLNKLLVKTEKNASEEMLNKDKLLSDKELDLLEETKQFDNWLETINQNEFDEEIEDYLSNETLLHFAYAEKSKNTTSVRLVTPQKASMLIEQRENTLKKLNKTLTLLEPFDIPPIHPYDEIEVLQLARKKVLATPLRLARFEAPVDTSLLETDLVPNKRPTIVENKDEKERKELQCETSLTNSFHEKEKTKNQFQALYETLSHILPQQKECQIKKQNQSTQKTKRLSESSSHMEHLDLLEDAVSSSEFTSKKQKAPIIYAWDPFNQSLVTKKKLEKLEKAYSKTNSPPIPIKHISLIESTEKVIFDYYFV